MTDSNDIYQTVSVRDAIYHAPLTHPDAPEVDGPFELYNSGWAGIRH